MGDQQRRALEKRIERLKGENQAFREKVRGLKKEGRLLEKRLEQGYGLLEKLPAAVMVVQDGKIIYANEIVKSRSGYSEDEILSHAFTDFVHSDSLEHMRDFDKRRIGNPFPEGFEIYLVTKNGEQVCCEVRARKIRYSGRKAFLLHLIGLHKRKAKERLIRQTEKMEASARMASGLGRELQNCLALFPQDTSQFSEGMHTIRERTGLLVQQLDCLSQERESVSARFDLGSVAREAVSLVQAKGDGRFHEKGVRVKTYLRVTSRIEGHPEEIRDVLVHLISNAVEALPDGGDVYLTAEEDAGLVHLYVQDNGVGIPHDIQDRIFDPFFSTKQGEHKGMGLSLAHAIVRRNKGEIEVMSREKQGTTVIVRLPLPQRPFKRRPKKGKKGIMDSHVLIVSQEGITTDLLSQLFVSRGGKVSTATSGLVALSLLAKNRFQMVIADCQGTDLGPEKMISRIKQIDREVPVALIYPPVSDLIKDVPDKGSADLIIYKPLDLDRVMAAVSETLAERA